MLKVGPSCVDRAEGAGVGDGGMGFPPKAFQEVVEGEHGDADGVSLLGVELHLFGLSRVVA